MPKIQLKVNGKQLEADVAPDTPLLWVLRDHLGLVGTKYGCGIAQCGYCQAGQIMTAAALLKQKPKPTEAEIANAMHGNICRCGTYHRIKEAVLLASTQK